MHDFDYDVMQKKRTAKGAQHRKGKRGGRTCRMMTDYLTEKQWKELNGKVVSYKMNEPITWTAFKSMPIHIQAEYLQHLVALYKVNSSNLAQMLGVTSTTVRRHIEVNQIGISFKVGNSMTTAEREVWERFLYRTETQSNELEHDAENKSPEMAVEPPCETSTRMNKFSLSFEGKIDVFTIANSILSIAGASAFGQIEIVCLLDDICS